MWRYNSPDELYHWGILGMKWGHRKAKNAKTYSKKNKKMSQDAKEAEQLRKKKLYELSNEELKRYNNRKQLEDNYKRLNKSTIAKGFAKVTALAVAAGTVAGLINNSKTISDSGKKIVDKILLKYKKGN